MTKKNILWTVAIVILITAVIVAAVVWEESSTSKRLSRETEVVGLTGTPKKWDEGDKTVSGHTLTFYYLVGEQVYTRTWNKITWHDPTKSYKVCYNPEKPDDAKLYLSDHVCGK